MSDGYRFIGGVLCDEDGEPYEHPKCQICKGEGWVCENHPEIAWEGGNHKCCGGAGKPCRCNTSDPPWDHLNPFSENN